MRTSPGVATWSWSWTESSSSAGGELPGREVGRWTTVRCGPCCCRSLRVLNFPHSPLPLLALVLSPGASGLLVGDGGGNPHSVRGVLLAAGVSLLLGPCQPGASAVGLLCAPSPTTEFLELKPVPRPHVPLDSGHPPCAGSISSAPTPSCRVAGLEVSAEVLFGSAVARTGFWYWFGLRVPPSTLSWSGVDFIGC